MNGNKQLLGANNSSTLFSNNGHVNSSAGGMNGGKLPMESQSNQLYGLPNFSPLKQNSETASQGASKPGKVTSAFSGQNITAPHQSDNFNMYGSHQQIIMNPSQQQHQQQTSMNNGGAQSHRGFYGPQG